MVKYVIHIVINAMRLIVKIVPVSGLHVMIALNILVKIVTWTAMDTVVIDVTNIDVANVQILKVS